MSIREFYPEFNFYGVSVYQESGSMNGTTYLKSAGLADVHVTHILANDPNDTSCPFKFTAVPQNSCQRSFEILDVELFFFAPATCKDEDKRTHTNSPSTDDEDFQEVGDDFVDVESQNNLSANKKGILDSISFKRATQHGLYTDAQSLHPHIFNTGDSTVQMFVHNETVEFRDILISKRWIIDS